MAEIFEKNGKIIILQKQLGETQDELYQRAIFIMNNIDNKDFNLLLNKSFLFLNIFIRKNEYGSDILKKLTDNYDCSIY